MVPGKCPNCGAPLSGESCPYCGQKFLQENSGAGSSADQKDAYDIQVIESDRGVKEIVMILLGGLWVLLVLGVAIDLEYWHSLTDIAAALILAVPGIIFVIKGFKKKKKTVLRRRQHR